MFRIHMTLYIGLAINLAYAAIKFCLTTAMLVRFGGADAPGFAHAMNAAVGGGVCFLVFLLSVHMLVESGRALRARPK